MTPAEFFVKDQGYSNYKRTGTPWQGDDSKLYSLLSCFLPRVNILKIFGLVEHEIFGLVNIVSTCKTDRFVMFYEFQGHTFSMYSLPKGLVWQKEEKKFLKNWFEGVKTLNCRGGKLQQKSNFQTMFLKTFCVKKVKLRGFFFLSRNM